MGTFVRMNVSSEVNRISGVTLIACGDMITAHQKLEEIGIIDSAMPTASVIKVMVLTTIGAM